MKREQKQRRADQAAHEVDLICKRWGISSLSKLATEVDMDPRTVRKLKLSSPDPTISEGAISQLFKRLMMLRCLYVGDKDLELEKQLLMEAHWRIMTEPEEHSPKLLARLAQELESQCE